MIGVEFGLQPHLGERARDYVQQYPFDYVIGSTHMLHGLDPYIRENFQNHTDKQLYREMFEETLINIQNVKDFDSMGHLDYIVRYGLEREKAYSYKENADVIDEILKCLIQNGKGLELNTAGLKYGLPFAHPYPEILKRYREKENADVIDEILKCLIQNGKGLELNTAGLKYGLPFAHPYPEILKRYRELGGEIITVGSDGHKPEHLAYDFHKVKDILLTCGFKYYTEFRKRKPIFKQVG